MSEPEAQIIKKREEVREFLNEVYCLLDEGDFSVNDKEWRGNVNKTQMFLAERNISYDDVVEVVRNLKVSNYSYTSLDRNSNYPNEEFWLFGNSHCFVDQIENLYIKLKVRHYDDGGMLLIMSFHPEVLGGDRKKIDISI